MVEKESQGCGGLLTIEVPDELLDDLEQLRRLRSEFQTLTLDELVAWAILRFLKNSNKLFI
jgi:hypothetical protein